MSRVSRNLSRTSSRPFAPNSLAFSGCCSAHSVFSAHSSTDSTPDLERDTAGAPRHDRGSLPERLGDDQPEALADRLLDHHVGEALKGVDLDVSYPGKVGEDVDLRVFLCRLLYLVVDLPPFWVVERH